MVSDQFLCALDSLSIRYRSLPLINVRRVELAADGKGSDRGYRFNIHVEHDDNMLAFITESAAETVQWCQEVDAMCRKANATYAQLPPCVYEIAAKKSFFFGLLGRKVYPSLIVFFAQTDQSCVILFLFHRTRTRTRAL